MTERRVEPTRRLSLTSRLHDQFGSPQFVTAALVAVGAALRLWQYLANSSLWMDELALSRNIIDRSLFGLWKPLDYAQLAPPGFLLVQKTLISLCGSSEFTLRAFPLICGLSALGLFRALSKRILAGWAVPYAVGLFSLGIPFIYFSSQAKQYSSDVAATLLLVLITLKVQDRGITLRRAFWLGIAGAVIVWFSQPALFVMAGIGAALLISTVMERQAAAARLLVVTWTLWGISAAAAAIHSVSSVAPLDAEYLRWFWADGFMPMPPRTLSDLAWLPARLVWVFGAFGLGLGRTNGGLNYRWSPVFSVVMAFGYWALWRKQRSTALFLALPVVIVVILSAASLYPFGARQIAFLIPFLLLATGAGAGYLLTHWPARIQFSSPVLMAILGGAPLFAIATALPPSWLQHIRPVLEHVQRQRETDDKIYVYYGANASLGYFAPRLGIRPEGILSGQCHLADSRGYFRELDRLRGSRRVWIVATHVHRDGEFDQITAYLDRIGRRVDNFSVHGSSGRQIEEAYGLLYDLSDPNRLASTSADTYEPVLEPAPEPWRFWGCYGPTTQPPY